MFNFGGNRHNTVEVHIVKDGSNPNPFENCKDSLKISMAKRDGVIEFSDERVWQLLKYKKYNGWKLQSDYPPPHEKKIDKN